MENSNSTRDVYVAHVLCWIKEYFAANSILEMISKFSKKNRKINYRSVQFKEIMKQNKSGHQL